MKAVFFEEHGAIDRLKFADLPDPVPALGEALIRVRACALNHLDIWVRRGWDGLKISFPHISGSDIAGDIVAVNGPATWAAGTRVIVNPGVLTSEDEWTRRGQDSLSPGYRLLGEQLPGGLAELVCVPIANVFKIPEHLSYEEAAAPLLVGTTVWRMLFKRALLQPGECVLVVGSGGGVNSLSIQIAASVGAKVIALAGTPEKAAKAKSLGASEVINYNESPNWPVDVYKLTKGRGVDIVVDNVGQATLPKSLRAVCRGGRVVTVGNTSGHNLTLDNRLIFTKQIALLGSTMGSRQDFLDAMQFIWQQGIKIAIDCVEPLAKGIEMLNYLENGAQFGKIILRP